jgi:hypothetical protein
VDHGQVSFTVKNHGLDLGECTDCAPSFHPGDPVHPRARKDKPKQGEGNTGKRLSNRKSRSYVATLTLTRRWRAGHVGPYYSLHRQFWSRPFKGHRSVQNTHTRTSSTRFLFDGTLHHLHNVMTRRGVTMLRTAV